MCKFLVVSLAINFVMLISGCSSGPPKPLLPDGSHRVPVNSVPVNRMPNGMPPVPASSVSPALPDAPAEGGGR
jgi:hypothetical protein